MKGRGGNGGAGGHLLTQKSCVRKKTRRLIQTWGGPRSRMVDEKIPEDGKRRMRKKTKSRVKSR